MSNTDTTPTWARLAGTLGIRDPNRILKLVQNPMEWKNQITIRARQQGRAQAMAMINFPFRDETGIDGQSSEAELRAALDAMEYARPRDLRIPSVDSNGRFAVNTARSGVWEQMSTSTRHYYSPESAQALGQQLEEAMQAMGNFWTPSAPAPDITAEIVKTGTVVDEEGNLSLEIFVKNNQLEEGDTFGPNTSTNNYVASMIEIDEDDTSVITVPITSNTIYTWVFVPHTVVHRKAAVRISNRMTTGQVTADNGDFLRAAERRGILRHRSADTGLTLAEYDYDTNPTRSYEIPTNEAGMRMMDEAISNEAARIMVNRINSSSLGSHIQAQIADNSIHLDSTFVGDGTPSNPYSVNTDAIVNIIEGRLNRANGSTNT